MRLSFFSNIKEMQKFSVFLNNVQNLIFEKKICFPNKSIYLDNWGIIFSHVWPKEKKFFTNVRVENSFFILWMLLSWYEWEKKNSPSNSYHMFQISLYLLFFNVQKISYHVRMYYVCTWIFLKVKKLKYIKCLPFSRGAFLYFSSLLTAMASSLTLAAGY